MEIEAQISILQTAGWISLLLAAVFLVGAVWIWMRHPPAAMKALIEAEKQQVHSSRRRTVVAVVPETVQRRLNELWQVFPPMSDNWDIKIGGSM